jgi:hypothetical protein
MNLHDALNRIIPYRLNAIATFGLVLRLRPSWRGGQPMQVFVREKLVIEGNSNAFANPAIEAGIVHCRAMLEFLGLALDKQGSLQSLKRARKRDDLGIENFSNANGPLTILSPRQAVSVWQQGEVEAEQALISVFKAANKGLAHFTTLPLASAEETKLLEVASRLIPELVARCLYAPLGLEPPGHQIRVREHEAG